MVLTYSLSHLYRLVAIAFDFVDTPNARSAHLENTPTGAGFVLILVYLLFLWLIWSIGYAMPEDSLFFEIWPVLLGIGLVGFIDDLHPVPWLLRISAHVLAAVWVVFFTGFPTLNLGSLTIDLQWAGLLFGIIAIVWLLNLYNFMDGIDGFASGEAIFVLLSAALISYLVGSDTRSLPVLAVAACCGGFLVINWPKAKVFMGDAGSGFLGLLFGSLTLAEVLVPLWVWLILLGWFITDANLTLFLRLVRGEPVHQAHDLHAYQHLNRKLGNKATLLIMFMVNLLWLFPVAALAALNPDWGLILLICAYVPLLILQFYCGAGQPNPRVTSLRRS